MDKEALKVPRLEDLLHGVTRKDFQRLADAARPWVTRPIGPDELGVIRETRI